MYKFFVSNMNNVITDKINGANFKISPRIYNKSRF